MISILWYNTLERTFKYSIMKRRIPMKIIYDIENLDCPHCAGIIEEKIRNLENVESASLSLPTKKLHLRVRTADGLLAQIQAVADSVEDGVVFHETGTHSHSADHGRGEWITLAVGVVLFVLGLLIERWQPACSAALILTAYLVMGWSILRTSVKNIAKGRIFDENFLMSVASIGALFVGHWEEAAGVVLFFRLGELFEHIAVTRSRKSVMEAIDLRPETANRLHGDAVEEIPAADIAAGDRLLVRAGDRIPVDGIIKNGESTLDSSAVTGESVPLAVKAGDAVHSGCVNLSGVLELEATAVLGDSLVSRILESVENAAAGKPKLDRLITRFARIYTPIVVCIALITAIVPSIISGDWQKWLYIAMNFLMISCPCALVLSVPLAFFSGIGAGSARGILFKDGNSLEVLAKVGAVVMDKTGTLTNGKFSVTSVHTNQCTASELLAACAGCEASSTHPVAVSICDYASAQGIAQQAENVQEIAGNGMRGTHRGRDILCGSRKFLNAQGISVPEISETGTHVYVSADGAYLGCLVLSDQPKTGASEAVRAMQNRGLHTVMLTGDSREHAQAIAKQLGIVDFHAELLPTEKPEYMQKIREAHGRVLFVGDGINDTPVLSGADVGAAMGSGADAAMEAADVVFLNSEPSAIPTALDIAGRVNRTAKISIIFALLVKFVILLLGFAGFANMWLSIFADTGVTVLCVLFVLASIQLHYRKGGKK